MKKIVNIAIILLCVLACTSCSKECQEGELRVTVIDRFGNPHRWYTEPRDCSVLRSKQWENNGCNCNVASGDPCADGFYRNCGWN